MKYIKIGKQRSNNCKKYFLDTNI